MSNRAPYEIIAFDPRRLAADADVLKQCRDAGGVWAAYQNQTPTNGTFLHILFMRWESLDCPPPETHPNEPHYLHVGYLSLSSGIVEN